MYKVNSIDRRENPALGFLSLTQTASSKIPEVYLEIMKLAGIAGTYKCYTTSPPRLDESLQSFIKIGLTGVNIGPPYQEEIIPLLATLSEGAKMIGAVNTVVHHGQFLKGYNTNALGLMDALAASGIKTAKCTTALIIGSGGAARSALFLLHWLGVPLITVAARNIDKAESITSHSGGGKPALLEDVLQRPITANIVINATSSSNPIEAPELADLIQQMSLDECQVVVDFNYSQKNNFFQACAHAQACLFLNGLTILAYQTRHALALWTGKQLPLKIVSEALQNIKI